jgi:CheY-like chemotaxis protein
MKDPLKILILEDSSYDAEEIMRRLELSAKFDCGFRLATDKTTYLQALDEFYPSVILSDHSLPQFDSKEALTLARQRFPDDPTACRHCCFRAKMEGRE